MRSEGCELSVKVTFEIPIWLSANKYRGHRPGEIRETAAKQGFGPCSILEGQCSKLGCAANISIYTCIYMYISGMPCDYVQCVRTRRLKTYDISNNIERLYESYEAYELFEPTTALRVRHPANSRSRANNAPQTGTYLSDANSGREP